MEFLAPRDEIKVPEKDLPKVEEIPKGASRRNMINNINGGSKHNSGSEKEEKEDDEEEDLGVQFEVDRFPKHLQMLHALLKVKHLVKAPQAPIVKVKHLLRVPQVPADIACTTKAFSEGTPSTC